MAKLVWNEPNQNRYEYGVDRGVYYPYPNLGFAWNGLISVEQTSTGGEVTPLYFEGTKYLDVKAYTDFGLKVTAYSPPPMFSDAIGDYSVVPGFILTKQRKTRFNFSYRTFQGGIDGYKIHFVYNIIAIPVDRSYSTTDGSSKAETFSWEFSAVPQKVANFRPTAHYILDSTKLNTKALQVIEDILYGYEDQNPRIPDPDELLSLSGSWEPQILIPHWNNGLADLVLGYGDLYQTGVKGIFSTLPGSKLKPTSKPGIFRLEP
jgi:hypothetical protein